MLRDRAYWRRLGTGAAILALISLMGWNAAAQTAAITIPSTPPAPPTELNPPFTVGPPSSGGAPAATPAQAADFAWNEFIALVWPAVPQAGQPGNRDTPSSTCLFGDPSANCSLLVWETFRGKVETFPGDGNPPPGYTGSTAATSWGYDATPKYDYGVPVNACQTSQQGDQTPWINLDETDQITLDNMYAGIVQSSSSPGNSAPQLIRFLAKSNRAQYVYVAGNSDPNNFANQWWSSIPLKVVKDTETYLQQNKASPPANSNTLVSQPYNTIEVKAGWRPLNPDEIKSGRFHTQMVRFYENASSPCYIDAVWGLVALHIIQKTPSAPYFIYATFEQADNILTSDGHPVEDADGNGAESAGKKMSVPAPNATTPQVCLVDPVPSPPGSSSAPSTSGMVILTDDPTTCTPAKSPSYCTPGSQIYYQNAAFPPPNNQPSGGPICVNRRDNPLPDYVIAANKQAHAAMASYLKQNPTSSPVWEAYKLINVQYYPYDKIPNASIPNGSPYDSKPPYTATNPAPSSYYQANIMVETNRSLQLFAGGLSPNIATEWNQNATRHQNTYYGGNFFNMGGCMGCHGSQGQNPAGQAGDFSVILARGSVLFPEVPSQSTSQGPTQVKRNRQLAK